MLSYLRNIICCLISSSFPCCSLLAMSAKRNRHQRQKSGLLEMESQNGHTPTLNYNPRKEKRMKLIARFFEWSVRFHAEDVLLSSHLSFPFRIVNWYREIAVGTKKDHGLGCTFLLSGCDPALARLGSNSQSKILGFYVKNQNRKKLRSRTQIHYIIRDYKRDRENVTAALYL